MLGSAFSRCWAATEAEGGLKDGVKVVDNKRLKPRGAAAAATAVLKAMAMGFSLNPLSKTKDEIFLERQKGGVTTYNLCNV